MMQARNSAVASEDVLTVDDLKAYFIVESYGVSREVRAVDGATLRVRRGEVYGLAGESGSGKTTLVKTMAGAIRPPLQVVGGTVRYDFGGRLVDIYDRLGRHGQAPLAPSQLHHAGLDDRAEPGAQGPALVLRLRLRAHGHGQGRVLARGRSRIWRRLQLDPAILDSYPHQLSGGMRQRTTIALATVCHPEFIIADEPTTALDVIVQRDVLKMIKDVQRQQGSSIVFVTHDMSVHADDRRPDRHRLCRPAGRGGADDRRCSATPSTPTPST